MIDLSGKLEIIGPDGTRAVFGDPSDDDFVGYLRNVSGMDSPAVRYSPVDLPMADGALPTDGYYGARTITIDGMIWPDPPVLVNHREEKLRRATNALRADCELRWWPVGQTPLRVLTRRSDGPRINQGRPRSFTVSLVATDPLIYSQDARSHTTPYSRDTLCRVSCGNEGTARAPWVARIQGPIANPVLRNETTGQEIRLTASGGLTLPSTDYVELNSRAHTVEINGGTNAYNKLAFTTSAWFDLAPGTNEIRVSGTGQNANTALTVDYRAAWI